MRDERELEAELSIFRTKPVADWLARLERAGVPAGPTQDVREMHQDPQTLAGRWSPGSCTAASARSRPSALPIKLSRTPSGPKRGAPGLGEHMRELLREHGFAPADIDALLAEGAIAEP